MNTAVPVKLSGYKYGYSWPDIIDFHYQSLMGIFESLIIEDGHVAFSYFPVYQ